jgi:2-polyprenyl-3-methyl-5-hydroxy-6-metoxy-1,4-benzoquinol methylase
MKELTALPLIDDRIPKWDFTDLKDRNCPFCKSSGHELFLRPDKLIVKFCSDCGCYFVDPAPSVDALNHFYEGYSQTHRFAPLTKKAARTYLRSDPLSDFRVAEVASMVNINGSRVLDIGCGDGRYALQFKKLGATVEGVDRDEAAVSFARNELGLKGTAVNSIENFHVNNLYDVVLMLDLIEHVFQPRSILQKASSNLADNGLLVIWTPNASFIQQHSDATPLQVDLEHIQYLSFETCSYLADVLHLEIVHLESIGFPSKSKHISNVEDKYVPTNRGVSRLHRYYVDTYSFVYFPSVSKDHR